MNSRNMFEIIPLIPRILIIVIIVGIYYYIDTHYLFLQWRPYLYYGMKIIIAYQILRGSARTLLAPVLTLVAAFLLMFVDQIYHFEGITMNDTWQLIVVGIIGFFIAIFYNS